MAIGRTSETVDAGKAGSIESALRRSLRAAVAGDWPTAETWLARIVEADSTDLDAYHALARLFRERGDVGRAIRMHQNLLLRKGMPRREKALTMLELAQDFDAGGFGDQAIASYEEVLADRPKEAFALHRLPVLLREARRFERGLAIAKRLSKVDRDAGDRVTLDLLLAQADAQGAEGDADGAARTLRKVLKRDKGCGSAWSLLGDLEAERGKDAKAVDAWQKAVEADARLGPALFPKIEAGWAARGKIAQYEKWLTRLIDDRPRDAEARVAHARLQTARGETGVAIEALSRAIERLPDAMSLHVELGRLLLSEGAEGEAQKAYAALLDALERGEAASAAVPPVGLEEAAS